MGESFTITTAGTSSTSRKTCRLCAYCDKSVVYTSNPPKYWCNKRKEYVGGEEVCAEFVDETYTYPNTVTILPTVECVIKFGELDDAMQAARAMIHAGYDVHVTPEDDGDLKIYLLKYVER